ncbi:MAG: cytochrome C [Xanthobacteraceae bacterium]
MSVHLDPLALLQSTLRRARAGAWVAAALGLASISNGGAACAENLDAGKSGARLFATNCTACHHSPKGLVKRTSPRLLADFMQLHYTASNASAIELAAYLTAVDPPKGLRRQGAVERQAIRSPAAARRDQPPRPPVALARP